MKMTVTRIAALAASLWAGMALAQETGAENETEDTPPGTVTVVPGELNMGTEVGEGAEGPKPGQTYTAAQHGDWEQRCVRTENGTDPCQLYQLLSDEEDNPVAEISVLGLPDAQEAEAGATIITPLETLLTQQVTLAVDGGQAKRYPFTFCAQNGCFSRIGLSAADVASFKRGNAATLTIVPAVAPDQTISVDISLSGFTAGYDAVNSANGN